jgi:hypothetical protein
MILLYCSRDVSQALKFAILLLTVHALGWSQLKPPEWAEAVVWDVRAKSFPELSNTDIRVRPFTNDSDYFRARFSILRFFFGMEMRYFVQVNSGTAILTAPEEGRRAIVAHELAHIAYYARANRVHLLVLLRLSNRGFRERFEKRADAEAIRRGYAQGLKEYRCWLYRHVPGSALPEKKRDYLSPVEIDAATPGHVVQRPR